MSDIAHEPPLAGDEVSTVIGSLERQRRTFFWKCSGLEAAGLRATTAASSMTLGGLLKHLALVEREYFAFRLHGRGYGEPWDSGDWSEPGWDWRSAAGDSPEELTGLWRDAVANSRELLDEALADGGLDFRAKGITDVEASLRRILADLIEEYARHTGHADIIRESIDGLVGEDAPEGFHY